MAKVSKIAHVLWEVINNHRKQSLMKAREFAGREMSLWLTMEKEAKNYLSKREISRS